MHVKSWYSRVCGKKVTARLVLTLWGCQLLATGTVYGAPTGGVVTSGSAAISQTGSVTNVNQSTNTATINWTGFSTAPTETVNFNQPNASSITLNRVIGNEASVLQGALNATGKVFLLNSNGILISKGATVNTAGFVASTLNLTDDDFNAGNYTFKANGSTGSVINMGTITASDGGYVAMLGNSVSNQGVITATKGTVALASGNKITLNFNGDSMVSVTIDEGTLNALVENKQAIYADGGTVYLTAKAADELLGAQVNNSGIVQARNIDDLKGKIELYAHGGTANVNGTLDASAPNGGDGGFIETSGDKVKVAETASITTKAASGKTGTWLIDPTDFTIGLGAGAQTESGIGVVTLQNQLANSAVTIQTSSSGTGNGDIFVSAGLGISDNSYNVTTNGLANNLTLTAAGNIYINAGINWNANTLTLNAGKNIYLATLQAATNSSNLYNSLFPAMVATGSAGLVATYGTGTNADGSPMGLYTGMLYPGDYAGSIRFSGSGGVKLNNETYTVLSTLADLQKIKDNPSGNFVLGASITSNAAYAGNLGAFTGKLNGFGNTLSQTLTGTGYFDTIGEGALVSNLAVGGTINQPATITSDSLGALANVNRGTIVNSSATSAKINYTTAPVLGDGISTLYTGGLVGTNHGKIFQSFSEASTINASYVAGGLVGYNAAGGIIRDSAVLEGNLTNAAAVTTLGYVGGLVGVNAGTIQTSYVRSGLNVTTGNTGVMIGGLAGWNKAGGVIDQSYVTPYSPLTTLISDRLAGFVWTNDGAISNSYSTQLNFQDPSTLAYYANRWTAGFVHDNSGTIDGAYTLVHSGVARIQSGGGATATVSLIPSTDGTELCGFACTNTGTIKNAYWSATVDAARDAIPASTGATYTSPAFPAAPAGITPTDGTTATKLTTAQAATFASYAGFNADAWGASNSGYPVLRNIPIYVYPTIGGIPYYGDVTSDPASLVGTGGLNSIGMQGGGGNTYLADAMAGGVYDPETNTVINTFSVKVDDGGYLDAGGHPAATYLSSNLYTNVKGYIIVNPAPLTLSGVVADKTYDGSALGTTTGSGLTGLVGGQTLTVDWSKLDAITFADANAGNNKGASVVYTDLSKILSDGAKGGKAGNYTLASSAATKPNGGNYTYNYLYWNPATSAYDLATAVVGTTTSTTWYWNTATKKFDISNTKVISGVTNYYNPVANSYHATKANSVSYSTGSCGATSGSCYWNPATQAYDRTTQISGASTIWYWSESTGKYDLNALPTTPYKVVSTTGNILPKDLTASFTGSDKAYDGSTVGSVTGGILSGVVGSDAVSLDTTNLAANFADAGVGNDKSITVAGLTLTGAAAKNYTIGNSTASADITPLVLQLGGLKTADGTSSVTANQVIALNLVAGDKLGLTGSATLAGSSAGTQTISSLGSLAITNPNYTLSGAAGSVTVGAGNLVVGRIYDNSATVTSSGTTTTVNQTADRAAIDWLRFNIAANETVNFVQPSASAIILNRVIGNEQSIIQGALNANGRVFIINSNGVLFKAGSSVNAAALVASTLNTNPADFLAAKGTYVFTAKSGTGSVINDGDIVIADGGFVALISGGGVGTTGTISTPNGATILASANGAALEMDATGLTGYTLENLKGTTTLGGAVNVTGGLLETAGATVTLTSGFKTFMGRDDNWSYSLPSVTVGGTNGNVAASFVNSNLKTHNVSLNALDGDLTVNDAITWSANTLLGLSAKNDITVNNAIAATGDSAGLTMNYGGDYRILTTASYAGTVIDPATGHPVAQQDTSGGVYGSITLSGANATLKINGTPYTLIHSLDQLDALDSANSQTGMYYNPKTGKYDIPVAISSKDGIIVSYMAGYKQTAVRDSNNTIISMAYYAYNTATGKYDIPFSSQSFNNTTYDTGPTYYWNTATSAYDIPQTNASKYYNPVTKTYDLSAAYNTSANSTYYSYNPVTAKYDIPGLDPSGSGKYYDPKSQSYVLTSLYTSQMVYDRATNLYDIASRDITPGSVTLNKYYNMATGAYDSTKSLSYSTSYYNPANGIYDLTSQYTISGNYALAGNLDASGTTYASSLLESFTGTLAGFGHTINGFTLSSPVNLPNGIALIGTTTGSTIRDLGLTNVDIRVNPTSTTTGYAAGLVATATGTKFSGDYVTGTLNGTGGLVGNASNSSFDHTFADLTASSGVSGGLVGSLSTGNISNSHVTGAITSGAGLVGTLSGNVANSYYIGPYADQGLKAALDGQGNIINSDVACAGLVCNWGGGTGGATAITNSFAIANIGSKAAYGSLGGLVGAASLIKNSPLTIDNSWWKGDINAFSMLTTSDMIVSMNIGGLVGSTTSSAPSPITINNSSAVGSIELAGTTGTSDSLGGLVGYLGYTTSTKIQHLISNSSSDVDINATGVTRTSLTSAYGQTAYLGSTTLGGLIGSAQDTLVSYSHASGDLVGGFTLGGLIGTSSGIQRTENGRGVVTGSYIDGSYFDGTLTSDVTGARIGALAGFGRNVKSVTNSYWSDDITAAPFGTGLTKEGQYNTGGNQALSQEVINSSDMQYYQDGTINQVLTGRAAAAAAQSAEARQAAFEGGQTASQITQQQQRTRSNRSIKGVEEHQVPSIDGQIGYADSASYSADIDSISADGVQYDLHDSANDKDKKDKKK